MPNKATRLAKVNLLNTMVRAKEIGARDTFLFQLMEGNSEKIKGQTYCDLSMKEMATLMKKSEGRLRVQLKKLEKAGLITPVYVCNGNDERLETEDWKEVLVFGLPFHTQTKYRIEIGNLIGEL